MAIWLHVSDALDTAFPMRMILPVVIQAISKESERSQG